MKIILAGGTGFIGKELVLSLYQKGHEIVQLTRKSPDEKSRLVTQVQWDGKTLGPWAELLDGADAVINLCGEPIAGKRWSEPQKKIIVTSRLDTTRVIIDAISKSSRKPKVLINASGAGFYGNRPDEILTESAPPGKGFLPRTCIAWEEEAKRAESLGVRVVLLRIGMVLEKSGGALDKLIPPFHFFAGGPLGNGKQGMPWIHRADILGIIQFVLDHSEISGPVNLTAPEIITNEQFSQILGEVLHRPSWLRAPAWALKILLGKMAEELLLSGQRATPAKILGAGYQFQYPELKLALTDILKG